MEQNRPSPRLFALCILLLMAGSGIWLWLNERPQGIHQWRQTDCTAQAWNYAKHDLPLLKPQVHNLAGKDGYAASEFPIIYYIVGKAYTLFGYHEYVFRITNLLIFIAGLWAIYAMSCRFISDKRLQLVPMLLLATAPFYFYYGAHFLPNVPAMSLAWLGWLMIFRWIDKPKRITLLLAIMLFTLAALLKMSEGLHGCIAGAVLLFHVPTHLRTRAHYVFVGICGAAFVGIVYWWYSYTTAYNDTYGNHGSLLGIIPIWHMNATMMQHMLASVFKGWLFHYFNVFAWCILVLMLFVFIRRFRQLHPLLRTITLWCMLASFVYMLLWTQAFEVHDYYMLTPLAAVVFMSITVVTYLSAHLSLKRWHTWVLGIIACISIGYNGYMQDYRIHASKYQNVHNGFKTMAGYLDTIGVSREDKVVCVPDFSPNISLYLIDRPGWTEAFNNDKYNIHYFVTQGAKYLLVADPKYAQSPMYAPYMRHKIGEYEGIGVYRIE